MDRVLFGNDVESGRFATFDRVDVGLPVGTQGIVRAAKLATIA